MYFIIKLTVCKITALKTTMTEPAIISLQNITYTTLGATKPWRIYTTTTNKHYMVSVVA